jgi:hypothetical protein
MPGTPVLAQARSITSRRSLVVLIGYSSLARFPGQLRARQGFWQGLSLLIRAAHGPLRRMPISDSLSFAWSSSLFSDERSSRRPARGCSLAYQMDRVSTSSSPGMTRP